MNGIHEVTGSIPVWSTNLRSPVITRRLSAEAAQPRRWTSPLIESYGWQARNLGVAR